MNIDEGIWTRDDELNYISSALLALWKDVVLLLVPSSTTFPFSLKTTSAFAFNQ